LPRACAILPLLLVAACKPPPDEQHFMPQANPARGKAAIARVGCASCHAIPGIGWPEGAVGPALGEFADQALIAGRLPNRPDVLAAFVRNAPAVLPGTTMPAMPLSEGEARDVAAYLYALGDR
jgi:cytochrome c1